MNGITLSIIYFLFFTRFEAEILIIYNDCKITRLCTVYMKYFKVGFFLWTEGRMGKEKRLLACN